MPPDPLLKEVMKDGDKKILVCQQVFEPEEKTGKGGDKFWCYRFIFSDENHDTFNHFATYGEYRFGKGGDTIPLIEVREGDRLEATRVEGYYPHIRFCPV